LGELRAIWPQVYVLLLVAESPHGPDAQNLQDFVRVIPPDLDLALVFGNRAPARDDLLWDELLRLSKAFPGFDEAAADLGRITTSIKSLSAA
jgi:hypothetical protein